MVAALAAAPNEPNDTPNIANSGPMSRTDVQGRKHYRMEECHAQKARCSMYHGNTAPELHPESQPAQHAGAHQ
jgi:hypothetical protein